MQRRDERKNSCRGVWKRKVAHMKKSFRKNGVNVAVCIFQEVKDGECIFEWDSTDYPELYAISREGNDYNNTTCTWAG
jgi:hypothetical protein